MHIWMVKGMSAEIVFQMGGIIFAVASIMFLFAGMKKPHTMTEFFISFITTTSYAIMSLGIATTTSAGGAVIYWSRWLFYMAACSLLMFDTAHALSIGLDEYPKMAIFTGLTMFNGFLASYIVTDWRWIFFALSSAAYLGLLSFVIRGKVNPQFRALKPFVVIGWTLFPVVFLLAPTGVGILDTVVAEASYLLLDITTKIIYGIMTVRLKAS
jgi:sensory rhodopsin